MVLEPLRQSAGAASASTCVLAVGTRDDVDQLSAAGVFFTTVTLMDDGYCFE